MNYGQILKKYRERSGYTQEELAFSLHTEQPCISKIENGHRAIDLAFFLKWLDLMKEKENLLKEIGLAVEYVQKKDSVEEAITVFQDMIPNEMLLEQHQ